jgi:hypothetical protein
MTFVSLKFFPGPFTWIFGFWFTAFLYAAISAAKPGKKLLLFYISLIPFTFGIYESYLWMTHKPFRQAQVHDNYTKGVVIGKHKILGYAPRKNTTASHARYYNDTLIFNARYTIGPNGLRIPPPYNPADSEGCVLFFGGSCTFGTGVNDNQTIPYLTGLKTHGRYRVYNFAFRGYGPHQMLSAIEHGMVGAIIKCKPKYAVYQALPGHIARAAGLKNWDKHGPRYILGKDGKALYDGHFDDRKRKIPAKKPKTSPGKPTLLSRVMSELKKSFIFKKTLRKKKRFNGDHINLFIEIVNKSRQMLKARHPGCRFHVISWDDNQYGDNPEVLQKLKERGIRVHLLSDILPDFNLNDRYSKYRISIYDPHPNALANEKIAEYVAGKIIGNEENQKKGIKD